MKIFYQSDVHFEMFDEHAYSRFINRNRELLSLPMKESPKNVMVLAGDFFNNQVAPYNKSHKFFVEYVQFLLDDLGFDQVFFVMGNHDYWYSNISFDHESLLYGAYIPRIGMLDHLQEHYSGKFMLLNRNSVKIDNVKFMGCTLWTDLHSRPYDDLNLLDYKLRRSMNEPKLIHVDGHDMRANDWLSFYQHDEEFILDSLAEIDDQNEVPVLITHFLPGVVSSPERFAGDSLNAYFYPYGAMNDVINIFDDPTSPKTLHWVHGHTHDALEKRVPLGDDREILIHCNPHGYISGDHRVSRWNYSKVIEV